MISEWRSKIVSAILAAKLKTAKTNALNNTLGQLESLLQIAESNIANYNVGLSDPDTARSEISIIRSNEYKTALNNYLQILLESMASYDAVAIQSYLQTNVYVSYGKLICP